MQDLVLLIHHPLSPPPPLRGKMTTKVFSFDLGRPYCPYAAVVVQVANHHQKAQQVKALLINLSQITPHYCCTWSWWSTANAPAAPENVVVRGVLSCAKISIVYP
jgi:hypothetical protein